jgi:hypothetical protein
MYRTRSLATKPGRWVVPALALLVGGGCASGLSKDECHLADWRTIGYEDGVQGRSEAAIGKHRKACARHGVAPDFEAYQSGREEGLSRYCQPGNGYSEGLAGRRYDGICPGHLEPGFLQAYQQGKQLYSLERDLRQIERELRYKHNRLADIEVEMRDTGLALVQDGLSTEQRIILLDELRKLEQERSQTRAEIPSMEAERDRQSEQLANLKSAQMQ